MRLGREKRGSDQHRPRLRYFVEKTGCKDGNCGRWLMKEGGKATLYFIKSLLRERRAPKHRVWYLSRSKARGIAREMLDTDVIRTLFPSQARKGLPATGRKRRGNMLTNVRVDPQTKRPRPHDPVLAQSRAGKATSSRQQARKRGNNRKKKKKPPFRFAAIQAGHQKGQDTGPAQPTTKKGAMLLTSRSFGKKVQK